MKSWSTVDQLVDRKSVSLINSWSTLLIYFNLLINCWLTCWHWHVDQVLINMLVLSAKKPNSACWSTVEQLYSTQHCWTTVDQHVEMSVKSCSVVDQLCYFWVIKLICWSTRWFWSWFMLINCWSTLLMVGAEVDQQLINMLNCESTCWSTVDQFGALSSLYSGPDAPCHCRCRAERQNG